MIKSQDKLSAKSFQGKDEDLLLLPEKLQKRLLAFQREGVKFALSRDGRCLIADEMGLGKTVQAISVAYLYRQEWPLLIVVPSSLKYPWIEELERWVPELMPEDINLVESKADITGISQSKVTVLGYGLLTTDAKPLLEALNKQRFGVVIVDESHYLKSRNAARTKILVPVIQNAKHAILLTGTPALGRPEEEASASFEQWERLMRSLDSGESDSENPFTEVMSLITQMYKQTAVAKAGAVKDYIKMMLETEQLKFLVFAHHLCMLQACTEAVIEAKAGYIRIDGSVPSAERIQLVHRFQNDPDTRVAILSIQAAGQGLTLTAASHVVFAELYWNPGHVKQAEDRAHRIGQTSSVHVHYLIAKGTFDMVMWGMLNRKETVTGSTLNGRKDYLKAEEGDKEKWDFLNFAQAWTPSDCAIGDEDDKEGVFFSHFEKDKQHDIRKFFSPTADKDRKRKRTGDSSVAGSPPTQSHDQLGANQSPHNPNPDSAEDFCPQVKRLRQASPLSRRSGGKRSPLTPLSAPCRLSAGLQVPRHSQTWSCGVCTFSNSGLLLRCEMCETPRAQRARSPSASPSPSPSLSVSSPCITLSDSEGDQATSEASGDRPIAITPQTPLTKQSQLSKEDEEERSTLLLQESQTDPSTDNDGSGCNPVDDFLPVYDSLKFCASKNTDRIYVYDQDGLPLNCNFIPLDIRMQNWEDLPPEFSRTENRRHVVRFVHEWSFLTAMKQRMVRKSGQVFSNPILLLDELTHTQRRHSSTKRYLSKQDVAQTSLGAAQREGGTVRIINKDSFPSKRRSITKLLTQADKETEPCSAALEQTECVETGSGSESGYVQALDSGGNPLCLSCQKPSTDHSGWAGGFCSAACMEEFQLRSNQSYMRARVLEAEEGVCQHCGLHAHQLYLRVRDAPHTHRKEILDNTWLAQLPLKQLNEMIRNPVEGQFWQVDHINPVYSGGGQCLLDNLQTLCTVCHRMRTAQQAKERSQMKKGQAASKLASDITRFFTKK
ncbi:DNA annealing helicase and endonuclease ZRANB3 isoform X3 [Pygocentrus nattereri]|uniref:DNA annealing helicase and endonuclease ZRANB3 isoform X3 n=1 Tax=Pygocentrus nattereri TaxID=42514 RepID=UPI0018916ECF|nr:DNA annealing helicase and endonuclease ZRANB3 isoform X3 [Pygocentrus nattereri]